MSPPPCPLPAGPRAPRFSWTARLEHTLLQLGCRYLPGLYGLCRRWHQWLHRWWPSPLEQTARLLQIVPPLTASIGSIEPVDHPGHSRPTALLHLEFLYQEKRYRAVVDPSKLPRKIARCPPREWIPLSQGTSRVLPLLQCDYGPLDVLPIVEMYAGPRHDFYRDVPWVVSSPRYWLSSALTPLWSDPGRPIACLWDSFETETFSVNEVDRLVARAAR